MNEGHLRRRVQRLVFLVFLGGLLVTLAMGGDSSGTFEQAFVSPGELSHVHARFECGDCHSSDLNSWKGLLASVWSGEGDTFASEGCLTCHDQGSAAMHAHGVSPKALRDKSGLEGVAPFIEETECAVCHSEHGHGSHEAQLSDARCQTCHQQQFESFTSGHPPFSEDYGNRPRALSFSHSEHALRHFQTMPEFAPASCSGCHQLNSESGDMTVRPFEQSCSPCHSDDILKSEAVKFFALPTIFGLEELEEEGMGLGDWPYIDALELSPWTRRWYRSSTMDGEFSELMKRSEIEVDEPGNPAKARQVQEFAMTIKRSLLEDMRKDLQSWTRRLLPGENIDWSDDQLSRLSGQFPIALLNKIQERWFPDLAEELNRFESGMPISPPVEADSPDQTVEETVTGEGVDEVGDLLAGSEDDLLIDEEDLLDDEDDLLVDSDDDLLLEEEDLLGGEPEQDTGSEDDGPVTAKYSLEETTVGRDWANLGGWYEDAGVVWYRAVQHADPFLKAWIEAEKVYGDGEETSKEILSLLLAENAPGKCSKCHTGVTAENDLARWSPHQNADSLHFSKFSHADHVFSDDDLQCTSCHEPRTATAASGHDWFPVRMDSCTDCHGQEVADDCTLCHQYHASPGIRKLKAASVDIFRMKKED